MAPRLDDHRHLILTQWRRSGLSAREFAPLAGVGQATLYKWRRETMPRFVEIKPRHDSAHRDAAHRAAPPPAEIASASTAPEMDHDHEDDRDAAIEVVLPRGVVVRVSTGFDAAVLRAVVEALG